MIVHNDTTFVRVASVQNILSRKSDYEDMWLAPGITFLSVYGAIS